MKCKLGHSSDWRCLIRGSGHLFLAALFAAALGSAGRLEAAVIYSNLGPNDSFSTSPGIYPIWSLTSGAFIERAAAFTVPGLQPVHFGSADLGFHLQTGENSAAVTLAENGAGDVPGATIETILISLPEPSANPVIVTATSNTNPILSPGATYWITASVLIPGTMATWGPNITVASGGNATRTNFQNGQWFAQASEGIASLRVNSVQVPEPAGIALVAIGLAALVAGRRRTKR